MRRNIGLEIVQGIREIKRGQIGRVIKVTHKKIGVPKRRQRRNGDVRR